jgi:AraC-like DNA-binding protein
VTEAINGGKVYSASTPLARKCSRLADEAPPQSGLDHRAHVLRIVSAILTQEFKAARPKLACCAPARNQIVQVFEGLQTNELLNLSVGELAKKFNCSRRHLNRLFRKHWGLSVASLRMEMRLLKAASLLVEPEAKIYTVAAQCGFNHVGPFNSCFKKRFGASPSRWRTGCANGENPLAAPVQEQPLCPMRANGLCPWHMAALNDFAIVPERVSDWKR